MRKNELDKKIIIDNKVDTSFVCGLSMDQIFGINNIYICHQITSDRQMESSITAFTIEESTISKQLK